MSLHQRLLTCQYPVRDYQGSLYPGSQLHSKERGTDNTHTRISISRKDGVSSYERREETTRASSTGRAQLA